MNEAIFTNAAVETQALPTANHLTYEGLAPTYARTMIIEWLVSWILIAASNLIIIYFVRNEILFLLKWWTITPYFAVLLSVLVWAPAVAKSRGYALREQDIHYMSGLIWRKVVSLPFNRIQHVEMESGPLERIFKLTTLKFFTAGGGSADMKIPALTFGVATKVKAYVLEKAGVDAAKSEGEQHDLG